jgi:hypothetical protein
MPMAWQLYAIAAIVLVSLVSRRARSSFGLLYRYLTTPAAPAAPNSRRHWRRWSLDALEEAGGVAFEVAVGPLGGMQVPPFLARLASGVLRWRTQRLVAVGSELYLGDDQMLALSPSAAVRPLEAADAAAMSARGWALELWAPPRSGWVFCLSSEAERERLLDAMRDAIDLSHGPDAPYARWSLGETLGEGTFGTVRAATRRDFGEGCACKVLSRAHLAQHGNAQAAVDREIAVMKTVYKLLPARAPLVRLLEVSEWAGALFFFISPRCSGDLLVLLRDDGAFDEPSAAQATRGALLGLAALHRCGVAHLDVKPQNLLFRQPPSLGSVSRFETARGPAELFLADFGCAREVQRAGPGGGGGGGGGAALQAARGGWRALKSDGGGTLYFSAPEIIEEGVQATSADVWAAGCVCFSLLHRRPPFVLDGETDEACRLRILRAEPVWTTPPAAAAAGSPHVELSDAARSCLDTLFARDWRGRASAEEALAHPWLAPPPR